jgi:hypothetical protein
MLETPLRVLCLDGCNAAVAVTKLLLISWAQISGGNGPLRRVNLVRPHFAVQRLY